MMSRAASPGMPCCRVMTRRTLAPAAASMSPSFRFLIGTLRRTMRVCRMSQTALILVVFRGEGEGVVGFVEVD